MSLEELPAVLPISLLIVSPIPSIPQLIHRVHRVHRAAPWGW